MLKRSSGASGLAALLLVALPVLAHHSFGAEYDVNKPITLTGVVTKIEWTNPHSHFYLDVKDDKGAVVNWKFEGYPPSVLYRTGWKKDVTLEAGRHHHRLCLARARRHQLGAFARGHVPGRQEAVLRASGGHRRRRRPASGGGEVMRRALIVAALLFAPALLVAQTAPKSAVPRAPDGKPDLTGVWQGASSRRGSWEEANSGTGVGGSGKNPNAPVALASTALGPGREPAPYQPWAAKKVLESFNNRAVDDPVALCLPPGIPRTTTVGLFPMQIIQTPKQVAILYEYMNVFRVIPLNAKHPDDLEPSYMGDSVGHWEGDTLVVDVTGFNDKNLADWRGYFPHGSAARHRALHARRQGPDQLRCHHGRSQRAHQAVELPYDHHAARRHAAARVPCAENNLDPGRYEKLLQDGVNFRRQ